MDGNDWSPLATTGHDWSSLATLWNDLARARLPSMYVSMSRRIGEGSCLALAVLAQACETDSRQYYIYTCSIVVL